MPRDSWRCAQIKKLKIEISLRINFLSNSNWASLNFDFWFLTEPYWPPLVVVFREEVSAGEQQQGFLQNSPVHKLALVLTILLDFGLNIWALEYVLQGGFHKMHCPYCKVEGRAKRIFSSCLHCFHDGHIHLPDDTLLINIIIIVEDDDFPRRRKCKKLRSPLL